MPTSSPALERRTELFDTILGEDGKTISNQLRLDNGHLPTTLAKLKGKLCGQGNG